MRTITIKTDNAAFSESGGGREIEIARILRLLAMKLEQGREVGALLDYNGNRVGTVTGV